MLEAALENLRYGVWFSLGLITGLKLMAMIVRGDL